MNPWLEPEDVDRGGLFVGVCLLAWPVGVIAAVVWSLLA